MISSSTFEEKQSELKNNSCSSNLNKLLVNSPQNITINQLNSGNGRLNQVDSLLTSKQKQNQLLTIQEIGKSNTKIHISDSRINSKLKGTKIIMFKKSEGLPQKLRITLNTNNFKRVYSSKEICQIPITSTNQLNIPKNINNNLNENFYTLDRIPEDKNSKNGIISPNLINRKYQKINKQKIIHISNFSDPI